MDTFHTLLILDDRYSKKSKMFPVRLRITCKSKQYYFPCKVQDMTQEQWDKMHSTRPGELKKILDKINKVETDSIEIIENMGDFDWETFKKKKNGGSTDLAKTFFETYIKDLTDDGKTRTAEIYTNAMNSLERYSLERYNKSIPIKSINVKELGKYTKWLEENGRGQTSQSIYLRALRKIINDAIESSDYPVGSYPFGKRRFKIPRHIPKKKSLQSSQIELLKNYKPTGNIREKKSKQFAKDMFFFSFFCWGKNPVDICKLLNKHVGEDEIEFPPRSKTGIESQKVFIHPKIREIMRKHRGKSIAPNAYYFPFITKNIDQDVAQFGHRVNNALQKIAKEIGLPLDLSLGYARSSMGMKLYKSGVSMAKISSAMNHTSMATTMEYLSNFSSEEMRSVQELLDQTGDV